MIINYAKKFLLTEFLVVLIKRLKLVERNIICWYTTFYFEQINLVFDSTQTKHFKNINLS